MTRLSASPSQNLVANTNQRPPHLSPAVEALEFRRRDHWLTHELVQFDLRMDAKVGNTSRLTLCDQGKVNSTVVSLRYEDVSGVARQLSIPLNRIIQNKLTAEHRNALALALNSGEVTVSSRNNEFSPVVLKSDPALHFRSVVTQDSQKQLLSRDPELRRSPGATLADLVYCLTSKEHEGLLGAHFRAVRRAPQGHPESANDRGERRLRNRDNSVQNRIQKRYLDLSRTEVDKKIAWLERGVKILSSPVLAKVGKILSNIAVSTERKVVTTVRRIDAALSELASRRSRSHGRASRSPDGSGSIPSNARGTLEWVKEGFAQRFCESATTFAVQLTQKAENRLNELKAQSSALGIQITKYEMLSTALQSAYKTHKNAVESHRGWAWKNRQAHPWPAFQIMTEAEGKGFSITCKPKTDSGVASIFVAPLDDGRFSVTLQRNNQKQKTITIPPEKIGKLVHEFYKTRLAA